MKLLLLGSTGLVGRQVLQLALDDQRVTRVVAPLRAGGHRAAEQPDQIRTECQAGLASIPHPKLMSPQIDYENLESHAPDWHADAVICTLGTTMKSAKSQAAFRRVDHDYPLLAARLARAQGTPTYVLNSAIGADARSRFFYNRVKGELEHDLAKIGYPSLTFVRPGLIGGTREHPRAGERVMVGVVTLLKPILPRRWRLNPASQIARALLDAALASRPGIHVVPAESLIDNSGQPPAR